MLALHPTSVLDGFMFLLTIFRFCCHVAIDNLLISCGIWKNMCYLNIWVWHKGKRKESVRNSAHPYALCALYGLASYSLIYKKGILLLLFFILLSSQTHPSSLSLTSILITGKIDFLLHLSSQDRLTRAQRPQRPSLPAETTLDQFISSWLMDSHNSVSHLSWGQLCLARSKRIS